MKTNTNSRSSFLIRRIVLGVLFCIAGIMLAAASARRGGTIVFHSTRDGNSEIYSMNADGRNVIRLTFDPAIDRNPALSHDGNKVAFVSSRGGQGSNIYLMNIDGSDVVQLTYGFFGREPGMVA